MASNPSDQSVDPRAARQQHTKSALAAVHNRRTRLPSIDFSIYTNDEGQVSNTKERQIKDVQAPAFRKPTDEQFYHDETRTKPDIAFLKNHFYREGRLTDEQALFILKEASKVLREEPNLLEVDAPITGASLSPLFSCVASC